MAGLMNKRAIARNERALQELQKQPGNDRCADCFTRNSGWASWNLGIFLCVRCASLHRKLGTHISKVKSLSMDAWTQDQVESMKRTGNLASNRRYNPKGQNPNIPIDADEIDSAMERFIREKYQHKTLSGEGRPLPSIKHLSGNSDSSNDTPPPLPPKNIPRAAPALRSQSSTCPSQPSLASFDQGQSKLHAVQAPWLSGVSERGRSQDALDVKLDQLREMGFANQSRNATILKGCGGDVNKAADTLARLGEGYGNVLPKPRSGAQQSNGISFEPSAPSSTSFTPQSTGPASSQSFPNPASNSTNPFFRSQALQTSAQTPLQAPAQPTAAGLDQSFQNMNLANNQHSEQLFPHKTGTWLAQQPHSTGNPFMKSFTPPISPAAHQTQGISSSNNRVDSLNPFLRSTRSQTLPPSNPFGCPQVNPPANGLQSQAVLQYTSLLSQDVFGNSTAAGVHYQEQLAQGPAPVDHFSQLHQPHMAEQTAQQQNQQPFHQFQHHYSQQQMPQQQRQAYPAASPAGYFAELPNPDAQSNVGVAGSPLQSPIYRDKNSIMALYNTVQQPQSSLQPARPPSSQPSPYYNQQQPQRSVTMPAGMAASNPFAMASTAPAPGHVSRESMLFTGQAFPGRSASPEAFSGLSARHV